MAAVAGLLAAIVACAGTGHRQSSPELEELTGSTPVDARLYSDPHLLAVAAAQEDSRFVSIAKTPQAKWFSDTSPSTTVRGDIDDYLWGAEVTNAIPAIVLYRIPALDCGRWRPAGADDETEYRAWVDGAAAALTGHGEAIVILEPDALAQLGACEQGDRLGLLQYAVDKLSTTGARIYIDAGHENWWSAAETADRLRKVGVDKVAGFSLNVSNYNTTDGEVRFAEDVRVELSKLGVTDAHYVIDVSRNGAGPQSDTCNPPGARLGQPPQLFHGGSLDGLLWVKNPGETDGQCRGGPVYGFWPPLALDLLGLDGDRSTERGPAEWVVVASVAACGLGVAAILGFISIRRRRAADNARSVGSRRGTHG